MRFHTDVLRQRSTTSSPRRDDDIDTAARQQPDGGIIDLGAQNLLGAPGEHHDTRCPLTRRCSRAWAFEA